MSKLHHESTVEHSVGDESEPSADFSQGGRHGTIRRLLEQAMGNSLAALDRTRLDDRLADVARLREKAGADFQRALRREADKKFSRFLSHATTRARTFSAITGVWGLPGQLLDLPLFYIQAFKNAAEVALLYGFDPRTPEEQAVLLGLVRIGHLPTFELRKRAVDQLLRRPIQAERDLFWSLLAALPARYCAARSAALLPRALHRLAPLFGGYLNAVNSRMLMESILDSAQMAYRIRAEEHQAL